MPYVESVDELAMLLARGYWIETKFEESAEWEAYISSLSEKGRDAIFILSSDSAKHRIILENLGKKLGVDLKRMLDEFGKREFDFSNKTEGEIFRTILEHEMIARDLYSRLKDSVKGEIFRDTQLSLEEFTTAMESLIKDEEKHIKIVEPLAEKIMRIS